MKKITFEDVRVPLDVMPEYKDTYRENFLAATRGTGRLMLYACDQKFEHLNADFYGEGIDESDADPEHLFKIGVKGCIGVLAAQRGLIARYGADYPDINYLVKMNSKTNLVKTSQADPYSPMLSDLDAVLNMREMGANIVGVGYTRGKAVTNEKAADLIAGAAGVAACLGADFVKVNPPKEEGKKSAELLKQASKAAGRTGLVCAGGSTVDAETFLTQLWEQIHVGGAAGNATGRNIHQRSLDEAVRLTRAISAVTFSDYDPQEALDVFKGIDPYTAPEAE